MSFDHRTQGLTPNRKMPDSFYQNGFKQYMTRWGYAVHSAANWRFFALVLLLLNFCMLSSTVYFATRSTIVPYIVEVDNSSGAVISTSKVLARSEANKKEIEYFIWQIVKKTRTLPKDMIIYESNWNEVYTFLDPASSQKMNDMAVREDHRNKLRNGITTMLTLKTITPLSGRDDTFNVRWAETKYDVDGKKLGEYELEAFFTVEQRALDERTVYSNPLGIMVKDFNMSQVQ